MKNVIIMFTLIFSISANADYLCAYMKSSQEEHYAGFGSSIEGAMQTALSKCSKNWSDNTCSSGRFSLNCNHRGWACAYIKAARTAQEESYVGFGTTELDAANRALSACMSNWTDSTCNGYSFSVRCVQN